MRANNILGKTLIYFVKCIVINHSLDAVSNEINLNV